MAKKLVNLFLAVCLVCSYLTCAAEGAAPAKPEIYSDGDVVAVIGDSITHYGAYHTYLSEIYHNRFSDRTVQFLNLGVSGDNAGGALERLSSDILPAGANKAIVMLGMNDLNRGAYTTEQPDASEQEKRTSAMEKYKTNMAALVDGLQGAGLQEITLLTPTPFDETVDSTAENAPGYDAALEEAGAYLQQLAAEKGCAFVDVHTPLDEVNAQLQSSDPSDTIIGTDRIHPGDMGHLLIAYTIAKAQGIEMQAGVSVDFAAGSGAADIQKGEDTIAFTYRPEMLPIARDSASTALQEYVDVSELNTELLSVTNLPEGQYQIKLNDQVLGYASQAELAQGIDISSSSVNPNYETLSALREISQQKEELVSKVRERVMIDLLMQQQGLDPASADDVAEYEASVLAQFEEGSGSYTFNKNRLDNAKYVRENEEEIQGQISALQEEFEAIAPESVTVSVAPPQADPNLVYRQDFEGETSDVVDRSAASHSVTVTDAPGGRSGKALKVATNEATTTGGADAYIQLPEYLTQFYVEADYYVPEADNGKNIYLKFYEDGKWPYGGGAGMGKTSIGPWNITDTKTGLTPDTWYTVGLEVDTERGVYSIYHEGEKISSEEFPFRVGDDGFVVSKANWIHFSNDTNTETNQNIGVGYFDNIAVYRVRPGSEPEQPQKPQVLAEETFNDMTVGEAPTRGSANLNRQPNQMSEKSKIQIAQRMGGEEDDLCVEFSDYTKNSGNIQYVYDFEPQTTSMTVEFDAYVPSTNEKGVLINVNDSSGQPAVALDWDRKYIQAYRYGYGSGIDTEPIQVAQGNAVLDDWVTVKLELNWADRVYHMYLNGQVLKADIPMRLDTVTDLAKFSISGSTVNEDKEYGRSIYIDNLKIQTTSLEEPEEPEETVLADETFENTQQGQIPDGWEKSHANASIQVAQDPKGEKGNVLQITKTADITENIMLRRDLGRQSGAISIDMDYLVPSEAPHSVALYIVGSHGNDVVIELKKETVALVRTIDGVTSFPTIATGLEAGAWHHMKAVLHVEENVMQMWIDDAYIGAHEFRYAPETTYLQTFMVGAMGSAAAGVSTYVDNIKIQSGSSQSQEILSTIRDIPFDDLENGTVPSGWSVNNPANGTGEVKTRTGQEKMFTMHKTGEAELIYNSSISTQGSKLSDGLYQFQFEYNMSEASSSKLRYYLLQDNTIVLSLNFEKGAITSMFPDHSDTIATGMQPVWHTFKMIIDMENKIYYPYVDGKYTGKVFSLRNTQATYLNKQYFGVLEGGEGTIHLDNFTVTRDDTFYGSFLIQLPDPAVVDIEQNVIYNAPFGQDVTAFLASITLRTQGSKAALQDALGNPKTTGTVAEGDRVVITKDGAPKIRVFTIAPRLDTGIESLNIGDEEFASSSLITRAGAGKCMIAFRNNLSTPVTPTIVAASYDDSGRLAELTTVVTESIAASERSVQWLDIEIPQNVEDGTFKVMFLESLDTMAPYGAAITKTIATKRPLSLPKVFSDNMILQREQEVNIFGEAPTGAEITVTFADQTKTTTAADGRWILQLDPMEASSQGRELKVTSSFEGAQEEKIYSGVLVGDVYFGSGQSNMQRVLKDSGVSSVESVPENFRWFQVSLIDDPALRVESPQTINESWYEVNEANVLNCSAVMYFLAENLRQNGVDVPIGVIACSWGGTSIDHWMRMWSYLDSSDSALQEIETKLVNKTVGTNGIHVSDLFNGMTRSVLPYSVKATVWYQGESDVSRQYEKLLSNMISDYRQIWDEEMPFFVIQLPGYSQAAWAGFRLRQWQVQKMVDNTYVVVTNNTGEVEDIHPHDKDVVGEYLARVVLNKLYGLSIPYMGPVYRSMSVQGDSIVLEFDYVNDGIHGGLDTMDGELRGFEIAGEDGVYQAASARIEGDTVVVSGVTSPKNVRYGYQAEPLQGLCNNTDGVKLPAAPFRTDGGY